MLFGIIKKIFTIFLICALFVSIVCAQTINQKIVQAIKNEVVRRDPFLTGAKIDVVIKSIQSKNRNFSDSDIVVDYPGNMPLAGDVVVPIRVIGKQNTDTILSKVTIRIYRNIVVATNKIKKGDVFTNDNVGYSEKDVTFLPKNYVLDLSKVIGKTSSTYLSQGSAVYNWMLLQTPIIKNGDMVDLYKRANNVFVKVKAVAVEDGFINANIKVRNLDTNKVVEGKVRSSFEVEAL